MKNTQNNDSNKTNPNTSINSDFTELMFQLYIERYNSLTSILSDLRTKAGIFLAMIGVIATIGFSFSANGVISQYINIAAVIQNVNTGGLIGEVSANSQVYANNINFTENNIESIATINQIFRDGLTTLQTRLVIL